MLPSSHAAMNQEMGYHLIVLLTMLRARAPSGRFQGRDLFQSLH
uniref:Uncharacterized protein n=1 Tax=Arundo donax TaxID=35708 RepID=A0A0A9EFF0_ARUDO